MIEQRFRNRLVTFNIIQESIDKNLLKIENIEKEFIVNNSYDEVSNFLKTRRMFYSAYDQIQKDLGEITQYKHPDIEGVILERTNMTQIVRYWLYDLIDYFDFNKFSYYYFTLNIEERKLFNKKVKAKMGEEIKSSLLRQREPWRFVKGIEDADITYTEIYAATWKSIWFDNGFIRICTGKNAEFSSPYYWDFSEEKFNLLYDYILGRRLNELKISVSKGRINLIDGLDDLEEVIWKILIFKEAESSDGYVIKGIGQNRIPVNMILRNQCVKFLNKLQIKDLVPTRILEKTLNITKGGINIDISLLYSIPINNFEIAIIWESLELEKSKATHIFKCNKSEYSKVFSEIEHFLTSNIKVRSALNSKNSKDSKTQKILRYLCRIEHDNFNYQKWENSLLEVLPEIKVT